jgi:hypothetical protein
MTSDVFHAGRCGGGHYAFISLVLSLPPTYLGHGIVVLDVSNRHSPVSGDEDPRSPSTAAPLQSRRSSLNAALGVVPSRGTWLRAALASRVLCGGLRICRVGRRCGDRHFGPRGPDRSRRWRTSPISRWRIVRLSRGLPGAGGRHLRPHGAGRGGLLRRTIQLSTS